MATSDPDFSKLIPELPSWNNGQGISVDGWIGCVGSVELAIGYSVLFWPRFVEHDDCVLFEGFSEENYRGFAQQCGGDRERVEAVVNHRHIIDYFAHYGESATSDQLVYLGRVLRDIWQVKLEHDFPHRRFVVSFAEGPFEDLVDYEITFWQAADRPDCDC